MSLVAYNKLKKIFSQTSISSDIEGILHWDMSTMMPANARKQRSDQLAFMATLKHKLISDSSVDDLIREVDEGEKRALIFISFALNFNKVAIKDVCRMRRYMAKCSRKI